MKPMNQTKITFTSRSSNEGYARGAVAAFLAQLDPTVDELADIKTAVSEAVTNCIVHAYPGVLGQIYITVSLFEDGRVRIRIADKGVGIEDLERAMQPMETTGGAERAGLGFTVMQTFMDRLRVRSTVGGGTVVTMEKKIARRC
ncbi:MAG TPA: anti-sigma F factor [Candidatus Pygmaiobacter gallistercoris]|nr:anti-sigma F factor [Candidatus Pygmaiobacter gallistercoris]